jgi:hypothetical protein
LLQDQLYPLFHSHTCYQPYSLQQNTWFATVASTWFCQNYIHCTPYIHHRNSSSLNTATGVLSLNSNNHSLTLCTSDAMPYFPQQKELQHTITNFNQSSLSRCKNKTHKKEDMTCQSQIVCTVHCGKKA